MSERMSSADAAFLARESRTAPQHVGQLAIFAEPPAGFGYDRLVQLLEERISLAPRYRQKLRMVPGHLGNPLWVDDPRFDISYHVRRSALPRPGGDAALLEFGARIQARLLDRSRPLWEVYLVEGLSDGGVAIVTKTHQAIVSERDGIDLMQVVLDDSPAPRRTVEPIWMPDAEPRPAALVRDAVLDFARRPVALTDTVNAAAREVRATAEHGSGMLRGLLAVAPALVRRAPTSALQAELSEQRRLAIARTALREYREVRAAFGGSVNDVVLAAVTGALRGWLLSRASPLRRSSSVRALVPVSVSIGEDGNPREAMRKPRAALVRPLLVDLPVGEPDAVLRLAHVTFAMASHRASGRAVRADQLSRLGGFAPPTLHALGARAATGFTRRMFDVVITNVPGPQLTMYAAGARMSEIFPMLPLVPGHAVSVALTSYDGGVNYGLTGDRDAMPDITTLAQLIEESLDELVTVARGQRASGDAGRM